MYLCPLSLSENTINSMDRLSKYSIPFAGLAMGSHQFEYEIDDQFFEAFENSVIDHAKVHVDLDFHKAENVLTLTFSMTGSIRMNCDRCLEDFDMPVNTREIMLVRFGEPGSGETDDIIVIHHGETHLNVAQHIYDYLSLLVPIRKVHPDDEDGNSSCDPEILKRINTEEKDESEGVDPRWEALKNLGLRKN